MISGNMNAMAQEVSILLRPGWNWIGYPYPESVDIDNVFGDLGFPNILQVLVGLVMF